MFCLSFYASNNSNDEILCSIGAESLGCGIGSTNLDVTYPASGFAGHLFPKFAFPCSGLLTKMAYKAQGSGPFYLGIWEYSGSDAKLVNKTRIDCQAGGIQVSVLFIYSFRYAEQFYT